ncbi:MAG: hypothetical protein R3299_00935, partial [Arenibacter sp.]|nr:hypothetical protein [Arenibacter sp.]
PGRCGCGKLVDFKKGEISLDFFEYFFQRWKKVLKGLLKGGLLLLSLPDNFDNTQLLSLIQKNNKR